MCCRCKGTHSPPVNAGNPYAPRIPSETSLNDTLTLRCCGDDGVTGFSHVPSQHAGEDGQLLKERLNIGAAGGTVPLQRH